MTKEDQHPPSLEGTNWLVVGASIFCCIIASMQLNKVIPAIPLLRESMHLSMVASGWVMSIFSLSAIFLAFFSGVLADRFGAHRMTITGMTILLFGCLAGVVSCNRSFLALLLSRIVEGLGFALIVVSVPALIVQGVSP